MSRITNCQFSSVPAIRMGVKVSRQCYKQNLNDRSFADITAYHCTIVTALMQTVMAGYIFLAVQNVRWRSLDWPKNEFSPTFGTPIRVFFA